MWALLMLNALVILSSNAILQLLSEWFSFSKEMYSALNYYRS